MSKISSDIHKSRIYSAQSCTRAKVLGLYESRLTIRRGKTRGLVAPVESLTRPVMKSLYHIVSQSAMLKKESVHGCRGAKYSTYSGYYLLDDPWVILSKSKAFYYFCSRGNEIS